MSITDYCEQMSGGWLFGYVEALRTAGVATVVVVVAGGVDRPRRTVHRPTGATVLVLPPPAVYQRLRDRLPQRYA